MAKSNMNLIYKIQRRKNVWSSVFDTLDGQIDKMVKLTVHTEPLIRCHKPVIQQIMKKWQPWLECYWVAWYIL